MRLRQARVQNFRSVVDSGLVQIEERVTVLVGKNEQGKTTFLRGLASFNDKSPYSASDFPTHLRPQLEEKLPQSIPMVTIYVSLEPADAEALREILPASVPDQIKITKFYDGSKQYCGVAEGGGEADLSFPPPDLASEIEPLKIIAKTLRGRLSAHSEREPNFAPHLPQATTLIEQFVASSFDDVSQLENLTRTLATGLTAIPGQDAPIQQDVASTAKEMTARVARVQTLLRNEPVTRLEQLLPHFVYHSTTLDKIPNEVNIADFVKNPQAVSRGMANLCGVAGLPMQKIQNLATTQDNAMKETFEDHYRSQVSGGINEFWTQETYTVHFRFDQGKMLVSISDGTYARRIAPIDRSEGFQWYLSFFAALLNEVSSSGSIVFLLDNPGLELHADGQRDIKRFLEEKLPGRAQIIYVTHSPAMIDPFHLEQLRQVAQGGDDQGTKVKVLDFKEGQDFDLLEPVRSAIGASIASSLICNEYNVLVEGAADKPILEAALSLEKTPSKILVNGSVAESREGFLVRFYQKARLPFVVVLDGDSAGRDLAKRLKEWEVPEDKILNLADVFPNVDRDFELEDMLSVRFYHEAVREAYPDREIEPPPKDWAKKRTKYYEEKFAELKIGFNKRRVGEKVKGRLLGDKSDTESVKNLKILSTKVVESLTALTGAKLTPSA